MSKQNEKYKADRAKAIEQLKAETGGTPYHGYADEADYWIHKVNEGLAKYQGGLAALPTWKANKASKPQMLTVDDLAIGMFGVDREGAKGFAYGQLMLCYNECTGLFCHRSKAGAIIKSLMAIPLIARGNGYSAGNKGYQYFIYGSRKHLDYVPKPKSERIDYHNTESVIDPDDQPF